MENKEQCHCLDKQHSKTAKFCEECGGTVHKKELIADPKYDFIRRALLQSQINVDIVTAMNLLLTDIFPERKIHFFPKRAFTQSVQFQSVSLQDGSIVTEHHEIISYLNKMWPTKEIQQTVKEFTKAMENMNVTITELGPNCKIHSHAIFVKTSNPGIYCTKRFQEAYPDFAKLGYDNIAFMHKPYGLMFVQ